MKETIRAWNPATGMSSSAHRAASQVIRACVGGAGTTKTE
jgi:hypothetical protein